MDFGGHFLLPYKVEESERKHYLCLFTCLTLRAVHLEIAYGLDVDSFMRAFFEWGLPEEIISDNGTNFVGANYLR